MRPNFSRRGGAAATSRPSAMADSRLVEGRITSKLEAAFSPTHLEVVNESAAHNVPRGVCTRYQSWPRLRRSGLRRAIFRSRHHVSVEAIGESSGQRATVSPLTSLESETELV